MNESIPAPNPQLLDLNSLIAPGVVGTAAMIISNAVCEAFGLYKPWPAALYLIVALLFCLWAVWDANMAIFKKAVYCLLGALVIFSSASGQNLIGQKLVSGTEKAGIAEHPNSSQDSLASQQRFARACPEYNDTEMDAGHELIVPIEFQRESRTYKGALRVAQEPGGWCCIQGKLTRMAKPECSRNNGKYFSSHEEALKSCGKFFREAF
jgi:hypothetical protein